MEISQEAYLASVGKDVRKKAGAGEYFEEKNGTVDKRKI